MGSDAVGALTLGRWARDRAVATPERVAIDFLDEPTTYAELDGRSEALAAAFLRDGLRRGDRVAVLARNRPEHVEVLFACAKAGLLLVPLNWRLTAPELGYQLDDADVTVLLVEPDLAALSGDACAAASVSPRRLELSAEALDGVRDRAGDARGAAVGDDDPLLLVYTSGTTGRPKGALLTHANCFWTNLSLDRTVDVASTDVVLQVLPQFHVGGWNVQPLLAWWKGATVVLEPVFDAPRAIDLLVRKRVTTMMGVPATYLFLAEQPGFADADLSALRCAVVGGAPMPEALLRTWGARGVDIVQGYGLTEAAPNVLALPAEHAARKLGWAGKPYLHVDVGLRGRDGVVARGPGRGELVVRGPNVFPGYWRDPEATAAAFDGGWLRSGDVAERDGEGFYRIVDRTKDLYVSGGENVYPAEVEQVLADHPAVVECAVIGVPDERWGEVGLAAVVLREQVAPSELVAHARQRLAGYKVPRHVRVLDALPRSAMSKVSKTELRERFAAEGAS